MTDKLQAFSNREIKELSRTDLWAATMTGNIGDSVIHAHSQPITYQPFDGEVLINQEVGAVFDARSRCNNERSILSPSATFSSIEGKRARIETTPEHSFLKDIVLRTNFEKDRDRILHSSAFRRLAGKTQVYLNPDDHQRTRLTHALEVAQIAKAISRALRLNETLTEAIALGHDCGHGPGGHASEDAFDVFLPGGFNHATFGADVTLRKLNLCEETLDGIRNHSWSLNTPLTPEGEVVSFADRIAYVCHDMEDALSCGLISRNDFPPELSEFINQSKGEQIDYFIRGVIAGTLRSETIAIDAKCGEMLGALRRFNHEFIYQHELSQKQNKEIIKLLRELVGFYIDNISMLPESYRAGLSSDSQSQVFAVVEYVAGMTDQYANEKHKVHIGSTGA